LDKKKVIMDVDTGDDDAIALMAAALSGKLDILGVTVVHGNLPLENTVENTLRLIEFLKMDIPVYPGCPEPIVQYLTPGRTMNVRRQTTNKKIDGKKISIHSEFLNLPPAKRVAQSKHACSFIVETLKAATEKITIIAVGPLTNIGMALRMDPSIMENIEEIAIMGGAVTAGNRTPVAEANFHDDPEAAQIVLKSGCKLKIFTLEATETFKFSQNDLNALKKCSAAGAFASEISENFIERLNLLGFRTENSVTVHDLSTVCGVVEPNCVLEMRHEACDVEIGGGWGDGQLIIDRRAFATTPSEPVFIVYKMDAELCMRTTLDAYTNYS